LLAARQVQKHSGVKQTAWSVCQRQNAACVPLHPEKEEKTMRNLTVVVCSVLFSGLAWGQPSPVAEKKPATPESLKAEIDALQAVKPAWREIAWKSCLLEGLKEARAQNKPALLWVFIDRPIDDARC
jgi:hypothetical protein